MVRIKLVTDYHEFKSLSEAWDELVISSGVDRAFMRHLWFDKTISTYSMDSDLAVVTMWRDGQLCGIAPVYRSTARFKSVSAKAIRSLTTELSPRWGVIASDPEDIDAIVDEMIKLPDWDVMLLKNMESETRNTQRLLNCVERNLSGYGQRISKGLQSPFLEITGSWESYWKGLHGSHRRYLRKKCDSKMEMDGSCELIRIKTREEFSDFAPLMFEISRKSWKYAEGVHLSKDTQEGKFYLEFTPAALERDLVHLYVLKIAGKPVGFEYLLGGSGRITIIRCDFDEEFKSYSPGNSLRLMLLRRLFAGEGDISEYDFGGDDYTYKLRWSPSIRSHTNVLIGNNNIKGRLIVSIKSRLLPFLRKITQSDKDETPG